LKKRWSSRGTSPLRIRRRATCRDWLRYQPESDLAGWYRARYGETSKRSKRVGIVAVARKLLIALWRYATQGVVPAGAKFKADSHKMGVPKPRGANKTKLAKIQAAQQAAVA